MFSQTVATLMLCNVPNLITVRLQNVDYRIEKGLRGAIKDLFFVDKHRMFYKGLVPICIACTNVQIIPEFMHVFRDEEKYETAYAWPFVYGVGTLLVHPFFLLGMRV